MMMSSDVVKKEALITVRDLVVDFRIGRRSTIQAVSGISFHIGVGETLGLVGESGCGKSTIARCIVALQRPTAGQVMFDGQDIWQFSHRQLRTIRPQLQMIFQDAVASLNPGRRVGRTIEEPLRVFGRVDRGERTRRAHAMMAAVGLNPERMADRYPFEFSGGQCQRVSLARALILEPSLLICDEPVSSLDVSVQAQILNLLREMKQRFGLTMLFISHDLAVVKNISDRVAVMYLGKLCEIASAENLYRSPRHPYTALLLASNPEPKPAAQGYPSEYINNVMPSPADPPRGCRFHTRCPNVQNICSKVEPKLTALYNEGQVACHFPLERPNPTSVP
ncbi:oligopeptide/dipeptide ABC transporter ATP-binding protein [uncultured Desulfosarcina sp.]|uniref:ABC transporter ATP-binding protein n=1 Tax=uncultured Desulfosarcina sp. TaxID=218289 RepID=UPI0029C92F9B|nr:oligopeptide/dipeptide ABC transporter ATP-binding protein [uncultured Desulfosarcina sp.]